MGRVFLELPEEAYSALMAHLLPQSSTSERAAFLFAKAESEEEDTTFKSLEWMPVPPDDFVDHPGHYFELTDEARGRIIKKAHDLAASIVEFHSHLSALPASFSKTDVAGLKEFVPHVWWRLKGKPYMAVVVARTSFDALSWITDPKTPQAVDGIVAGRKLHEPTGRTFKGWNDY
jgi:hypothetical protein